MRTALTFMTGSACTTIIIMLTKHHYRQQTPTPTSRIPTEYETSSPPQTTYEAHAPATAH